MRRMLIKFLSNELKEISILFFISSVQILLDHVQKLWSR
jgi:hypothetical protein